MFLTNNEKSLIKSKIAIDQGADKIWYEQDIIAMDKLIERKIEADIQEAKELAKEEEIEIALNEAVKEYQERKKIRGEK